jgi:hypothetical protein
MVMIGSLQEKDLVEPVQLRDEQNFGDQYFDDR